MSKFPITSDLFPGIKLDDDFKIKPLNIFNQKALTEILNCPTKNTREVKELIKKLTESANKRGNVAEFIQNGQTKQVSYAYLALETTLNGFDKETAIEAARIFEFARSVSAQFSCDVAIKSDINAIIYDCVITVKEKPDAVLYLSHSKDGLKIEKFAYGADVTDLSHVTKNPLIEKAEGLPLVADSPMFSPDMARRIIESVKTGPDKADSIFNLTINYSEQFGCLCRIAFTEDADKKTHDELHSGKLSKHELAKRSLHSWMSQVVLDAQKGMSEQDILERAFKFEVYRSTAAQLDANFMLDGTLYITTPTNMYTLVTESTEGQPAYELKSVLETITKIQDDSDTDNKATETSEDK